MLIFVTWFIDTTTPKLIVSPHRNIFRGSEVILQCIANGTGKLVYSWVKDGKMLFSVNSTIIVSNIDNGNTGTYICSVSNGINNKSSNIQVVDVMCKYHVLYFVVDYFSFHDKLWRDLFFFQILIFLKSWLQTIFRRKVII